MAKTNCKSPEEGSISTHKAMITTCGNHRMFFSTFSIPTNTFFPFSRREDTEETDRKRRKRLL